MEQAALMAVQYDYDGAIELLKSQPDYESNTDMQSAVSDYEIRSHLYRISAGADHARVLPYTDQRHCQSI